MLLNKLHINLSKCCYIHFKQKRFKPQDCTQGLELKLDNVPIKQKTTAKFLGVIIYDKLSWDAHIDCLKQKLGYATSTLNRLTDRMRPRKAAH